MALRTWYKGQGWRSDRIREIGEEWKKRSGSVCWGSDGKLWWQDRWCHCHLRWQERGVTPPNRAVSLPRSLSRLSLSIGEMRSCDMWVCSKQTCQNDHWSENEPRCQRVSGLHATQTDTNTATTHTRTHIQKCGSTVLRSSTHSNVIHPTCLIQWRAHSEQSEPHRHSRAHACHTNTVCVFVCDGSYWIIHLWLVRAATSKVGTHCKSGRGG